MRYDVVRVKRGILRSCGRREGNLNANKEKVLASEFTVDILVCAFHFHVRMLEAAGSFYDFSNS